MGIKLNTDNLKGFVSSAEMESWQARAEQAIQQLKRKTGAGNDFLGWVDLPARTPDALVSELTGLGEEVRRHSRAVISIGIGGSYLGIRSTLEFLGEISKSRFFTPAIIWLMLKSSGCFV